MNAESKDAASADDQADTDSDYHAPARTRRRSTPAVVISWICGAGVLLAWLQFAAAWLGPEENVREDLLYLTAWYATFMSQTFLFHTGIAVLLAALVGIVLRRWKLVVAAVPLAIAGIGPELGPVLRGAPTVDQPPDLRVLTANLLYNNDQPDEVLNAARRADADVLLLQEYTPEWHARWLRSLAAEYPHWIAAPARNPSGAAIYSRLPLRTGDDLPLGLGHHRFPLQRVILDVGGRRLAIYHVHLLPPDTPRFRGMRQQFLRIHQLLAEESLPMLVGGDFNYTARSGMHERMTALGLSDAHSLVGTGRGTTWPKIGLLRFVPGLRIDRFYLSEELRPVRVETIELPGSDHRGVLLDVAVRRAD